ANLGNWGVGRLADVVWTVRLGTDDVFAGVHHVDVLSCRIDRPGRNIGGIDDRAGPVDCNGQRRGKIAHGRRVGRLGRRDDNVLYAHYSLDNAWLDARGGRESDSRDLLV